MIQADTVNVTTEILKRVDALAAKMNVAAGEIWSVTLKQVVVDAWVSVGVAAGWLLVTLGFIGLFRWFIHKVNTEDNYAFDRDSEMYIGMSFMASLVSFAIFFFYIMFRIGPFVTALTNPEYAALEKLGQALGVQ